MPIRDCQWLFLKSIIFIGILVYGYYIFKWETNKTILDHKNFPHQRSKDLQETL